MPVTSSPPPRRLDRTRVCTWMAWALAPVLAASAILPAGCRPSPGADASAVVLAATLPLSAPESDVARAWQRGYARAVADANRGGGVLLRATGRRVPVLLQVRDDRGEVARAQQAAEELLASGVEVLLATPDPVRMAAQAAVAGRFSRPYVVPAPFGPDLRATDRPWLFVAPRDGPDDEQRAYETARAALAGLEAAKTLDAEAVRRALREIERR